MNFLKYSRNEEISKIKIFVIIFICCLLYMVLAFSIGYLTVNTGNHPLLIFPFELKGIIIQLQLIISVYLVIKLRNYGYFTAVALNMLSFLAASLQLLISKTAIPLQGMISYAIAIFILTLIINYRLQTENYLKQVETQEKYLEISENKLFEHAYYDSLTKLPNRNLYLDRLEMEIADARRNNSLLGVIFIDLDSFKNINNTLGHSAGDQILLETAKRFTDIGDKNYMVARSGGDEFLLLVANIKSINSLEERVVKIMEVFIKPITVRGIDFFISGSAGIAIYPYDGNNAAELIKNADLSMYEAKRKGKNQYILSNTEMKQEVLRKTLLTNGLFRALERDEFFLHYQPQIDVKTGDIIGFEALLRWNNSEFGFVSPQEFIPIAEQTGLIKPIGLWVFENVCKECQRCSNVYKNNIKVSINFSLEQLKDVNILDHIAEIIEKIKIDPQNIEIEITESIAFNIESNILRKLMKFKEMGFLIAIDDFGKEYSSLNRIASFPADLLKIDMDFIHAISSDNPKDKVVVKTIIQLANSLGIKVLAEGVETEEQYQFLKNEMCDQIQGFYFYRGMPAADAENLLKSCRQ
ncbi:MAG: EAL domain-containing protein [Syntrophomonadaceae bacterium]|nr:EAL domain-containing protein [Syntrophomonadaceae bacterium]